MAVGLGIGGGLEKVANMVAKGRLRDVKKCWSPGGAAGVQISLGVCGGAA